MSGLPGAPLTSSTGYYSVYVPSGWAGTVVPQKPGYQFTPASRTYAGVTSDQSNQDYTGAPAITLSGLVRTSTGVGIPGVVLSGFPGDPVVTNTTGLYVAPVPPSWSGTVTPQKPGFTFTPASRTYVNVLASRSSENYVGVGAMITISGRVRTPTGFPISSVKMMGLPKAPSTNAQGAYACSVPSGWTGFVTPLKSGYAFSPTYQAYDDVASDQVNQDYEGARACIITGYVRTATGTGVAGVVMTGLPGNPTTSSMGFYTATVPPGWSGTVTPQKTGYAFTPPLRAYTNVTSNKTNQNYTGSATGGG